MNDTSIFYFTGSCFVGQQSTRSLLVLVLAPQFVYLFFGTAFLFVGIATLLLPRPSTPPSPVLNPLNPLGTASAVSTGRQHRGVVGKVQSLVGESHRRQRATLTRVGLFACLYACVAFSVAGVTLYEWWSRDSWLRAPEPSAAPRASSKPIVQLFVLRSVASLLAGVLAAVWIWWPNVISVWRRLPPCRQPPHKCHPAAPVVRCYSTGSTSPTPHQIHHLNHLAPQHPLLRPPIVVTNSGQIPPPHRGHKKHRKHRKHHSGSETQV